MFKFVDSSSIYLVIFVTSEAVDPEGDFEGSIDEEDAYVPGVENVVICRNEQAVRDVIHENKTAHDWAVFEVVGDKTERRAITYESDGRTVKGLE